MDKRILVMVGIAVLGTGCIARVRPGRVAVVTPAPVVYVDREPPPPNSEVKPEAPGPDRVWIGGYWRWEQRAYVWVPGRYLLRPHPRAAWVAGRWRRHARGWYWTEGRWR